MQRSATPLEQILDALERHFGEVLASWPADAAAFLVWWQCGYPPSEAKCAKGWESLRSSVGVEPAKILAASEEALVAALRAGGMVPELRAAKLREIADRLLNEFGGDLAGALRGEWKSVSRVLRTFPGIGAPGAERIALFAGIEPVAAVPSAFPHVLVRLRQGIPDTKYEANYRASQALIQTEVAEDFASRQRAFLLVNRLGAELCKASRPKCELCPVSGECAYFAQQRLQPR